MKNIHDVEKKVVMLFWSVIFGEFTHLKVRKWFMKLNKLL